MSLFLSVKDAAAELSVAPVNVLRLIALAVLPATKLGEHWKIDPDKLRAYVARGAPNLAGPPIGRNGWFDGDNTASAQDFYMAARNAMQESVYAEPPEELFPTGRSIATVDLKLNAALRSLLQQPEPRPPRVLSPTETTIRNWRDVYVMEQVRKAAREAFDIPMMAKADKLYGDGHEAFDKRAAAAAAEMLQGAIKLTVPYQIDRGPVRIDYRLPHGALVSADDIGRVTGQAF